MKFKFSQLISGFNKTMYAPTVLTEWVKFKTNSVWV